LLDEPAEPIELARPWLDHSFRLPTQVHLASGPASEEGMIEWTYAGPESDRPSDAEAGTYLPGTTALDAFVRLYDKPAEAFVRFAWKWGPIMLVAEPFGAPVRCLGDYPHRWYRDHVARWRHWSRSARAILKLGASLLGGTCGNPSDWDDAWYGINFSASMSQFGYIGGRHRDADALHCVDGECMVLGLVVSHWLHEARPSLAMRWDPPACHGSSGYSRPALLLSTSRAGERVAEHIGRGMLDLLLKQVPEDATDFAELLATTIRITALGARACEVFSNLALELASALVCARGIVRCDICGTPYNPANRAARADRRRYCSDWCRRQGHTARNQESRARKRASADRGDRGATDARHPVAS